MFFVAIFVFLMKIKNDRIRFKLFNKRIFSVFGDKASIFRFYLDNQIIL